MSNVLKKIISILPNAIAIRLRHFASLIRLINNKRSYFIMQHVNALYKHNIYFKSWIDSWEVNATVLNGECTPWMNYAIVQFLIDRVPANINIFEYGSGYSTIFWSKRCKSVHSVENDEEWFGKISRELKNYTNIHLTFQDLSKNGCNYVNAIDKGIKFDIVVIDGRHRVKCCKEVIHHLTDNGVIILDNSQREYYLEGIEFLKSKDFKELRFHHIAPLTYENECTSIYYRKNNIFNI